MNGINVMLNFFDNFSNGINRAVNSSNNLEKSLENIDKAGNVGINIDDAPLTFAERQVSIIADKLDYQNRVVKQLNQSYEKSCAELGYESQAAMKIENQLNNARNAQLKLEQSYQKACKVLDEEEAAARSIKEPITNVIKEQEKFNKTINSSSSSMNGLASNVSNLLKTYLSFQAIKHGITSTIGEAMKMQHQLFTIQGIMGNTEVGTAYFNNLQKKANESVFAFEDFAQNARNYMQFTKNTDTLDKLANLSERLTLVDPTQGLQGAGFAIKEMLSGDGTSLKGRFGFGKADIEILKASKDMSSFLDQFDSLLNKKGFTEDMLAKYNQSASAQFNKLKSNIVTSMGQAGNGALEALNPVITRLNQAFSNGSFQGFFNGISTGLHVIAIIIGIITDGIGYVGDMFQKNWTIISPIIWGIVAALLAYNASLIVTNTLNGVGAIAMVAKTIADWAETAAILALIVAQDGLNAAMLACPITWIIIGIIAVIAIFYAAVAAVNHFAGTTWSATGIICGIIATGAAFIGNAVLGIANFIITAGITLYNLIATFANFFATVFNDPVAAIANLFVGLFDTICGIVQSAASLIDTVLGSDLSGAVAGFQGKVDDYVNGITADSTVTVMEKLDASDYTFDRFDYGKSWNTGYNFGAGIDSKVGGMFGNLGSTLDNLNGGGLGADLDSWNKAQGPGNLAFGNDDKKNLKNINDKIDVSNEHLEMLTDLASEKSISNFVTLTPTVQVTTGDIRQEADINKIISDIETYMEDELQNSAEGLYA